MPQPDLDNIYKLHTKLKLMHKKGILFYIYNLWNDSGNDAAVPNQLRFEVLDVGQQISLFVWGGYIWSWCDREAQSSSKRYRYYR